MEIKVVESKALRLKMAYPAEWQEKQRVIATLKLADLCLFDQSDDTETTMVALRHGTETVGGMRYETEHLAKMPVEEFREDLELLAKRPYGKHLTAIRFIYGYLAKEKRWPSKVLAHARLLTECRIDLKQIAGDAEGHWIRAYDFGHQNPDVRIPMRAACLVVEAHRETTLYVELLGMLYEAYVRDPEAPEPLSVAHVYSRLSIGKDVRTLFEFLLREEHVGMTIEPLDPLRRIEALTPRDDILYYGGVKTVDDYLRAFLRRLNETSDEPRAVAQDGQDKQRSTPLKTASSIQKLREYIAGLEHYHKEFEAGLSRTKPPRLVGISQTKCRVPSYVHLDREAIPGFPDAS